MSDSLLVALYFLCAVASAFFSAAETALTSVSKATIFRLKEEGKRNAERLERLRANLPRTLGTLIVGSTLVNAAAGTVGAALLISLLGEKWGVLVATAVTAALLLVVAEVTPKTFAARRAGTVALALVGPVELFVRLFSPLTGLLSAVARLLLKPFGADDGSGDDATSAAVRSLITYSHEHGALEREETEILHRVLSFGDTPVREAMVPRARMVSLSADAGFERVERHCREHRYSRFPIWRKNPDDIVGVLHVKDLFDVTDEEEKSFDVSRHLRPAVFVPELKRAGDLLREMRRLRFHMAVVVDELGVIAGLVTMEDLIERIVGDISDEHDEPATRPISDGTSLILEGTYSLAALERDLGLSFHESGAETVAGFLLKRFGRIPRPGARMFAEELEFLVERASPRAIERVRITRTPRPSGNATERKAS